MAGCQLIKFQYDAGIFLEEAGPPQYRRLALQTQPPATNSLSTCY